MTTVEKSKTITEKCENIPAKKKSFKTCFAWQHSFV